VESNSWSQFLGFPESCNHSNQLLLDTVLRFFNVRIPARVCVFVCALIRGVLPKFLSDEIGLGCFKVPVEDTVYVSAEDVL
jgi:hypothetical protein